MEKPQPDIVTPRVQKRGITSGRKMTITQLQSTIRQQKDKVQELKSVMSEHREKIKSVDDASRQLNEQEKTLRGQEKEQVALLTNPHILPQSKQDVKHNLKKIRKWLFDIKEARATNRKSLKQLNDTIRQNERAIKINKRAVRENERALKIVAGLKEGEFELKAKGIEEMMEEIMPDADVETRHGVSLPQEEQILPQQPTQLSEPQIIIPPIEASGFGKMKEEDYWEKGKM